MNKYICVHGHFYQPPRENPWLETIEYQSSAYPYHDWNARITAECYRANSASRILDADNQILSIVNNYEKISFNFGPTVLSWIKIKKPHLLKAIIKADNNSKDNFGGHGAAIAQAYNHMIMPLANQNDKYTQIYWGIRDFEFYYNRKPEGLWLPETAVDLASLDIMAELGILFTILEPQQAHRIKKFDSEDWQDVTGGKINPKVPYLQKLPSGRSIVIFFYDGPASKAVAFENLLIKGEVFADRLVGLFPTDDPDEADHQLVSIATDGETYGHHHPHGDMALAYALSDIQNNNKAQLTVYGQYMTINPPNSEVEIYENTSWSCAHGIERWKNNCGCNSGQRGDWNQEWRAPLREALDWLRDSLIPLWEEALKKYFSDPWILRNQYIRIIQDRSIESIQNFFTEHAIHPLNEGEVQECLKLLELQKNALYMYTSCGWFFDEISGIETVKVMEYAARAIQLAQSLFKIDLEPEFLERLSKAPSNIPELQNGKNIYELYVKTKRIELIDVAIHYAISSIFNNYKDTTTLYCYQIERHNAVTAESGTIKLAVGSITVRSSITLEKIQVDYAVLYEGDQKLTAVVRDFNNREDYVIVEKNLLNTFSHGDINQVITLFRNLFGDKLYTLQNLFYDEQCRILQKIINPSIRKISTLYNKIYQDHTNLFDFYIKLNIPLPKELVVTATYAINSQIIELLEAENIDLEQIKVLIEHAKKLQISLDKEVIGRILSKKIYSLSHKFKHNQKDLSLLQHLIDLTSFITNNQFEVNNWKTQNILFKIKLNNTVTNNEWTNKLNTLCQNLNIKID